MGCGDHFVERGARLEAALLRVEQHPVPWCDEILLVGTRAGDRLKASRFVLVVGVEVADGLSLLGREREVLDRPVRARRVPGWPGDLARLQVFGHVTGDEPGRAGACAHALILAAGGHQW